MVNVIPATESVDDYTKLTTVKTKIIRADVLKWIGWDFWLNGRHVGLARSVCVANSASVSCGADVLGHSWPE